MNIVSPVLWQHAVEAAALWARRDRAIGEPHFTLDDLAKLDTRVEANLDGLRIAEADTASAAWDVCQQELGSGDPSDVFGAAAMAFEDGGEQRIRKVTDVATKSYEASRPLVSALGRLPWEEASALVDRFLLAEDEALRRVAVAAAAVHRQDPGRAVADAIQQPEELLRARALRAVGELGRLDLLPAVRERVTEPVAGCRLAAAWSVVLMDGGKEGVEVLKRIVEANGPDLGRALQLAPRRMDRGQGKSWLLQLAERAETARSGVIGAGVLGVAELVPWLLEQMDVSELARVAGEAFSTITGVDITDEDLHGEWPEGFEAGPTEDPEDENVEMDPDENLPWPDRGKIADWWRKNRDRFEPGTRYLVGQPMTVKWLNDVLRNGYQRQRAAAALELAIRQPAAPLFEVRAPGWRQQQLLG